jgi:hypothetical protein
VKNANEDSITIVIKRGDDESDRDYNLRVSRLYHRWRREANPKVAEASREAVRNYRQRKAGQQSA